MPCFADSEGRSWDVVINVATARRLKNKIGLDLYELIEDKMKGLGELLANPIKLCDALWVIVQPQAGDGVTDEQFGESLLGDSLERASTAFLDAMIDFFPDPQTRKSLRDVIAKGKAVKDRLVERANSEIQAFDIDAVVDQIIAKHRGTDGTAS